MPTINFDAKMTSLDGEELTRTDDTGTKREWPIGQVAAAALAAPKEGLDPTASVQRFLLAQRLYAGGEVELTAEEVSVVKVAVAAMYAPLVAGQIIVHIDPAVAKAVAS